MFSLSALFLGGRRSSCLDAADANDDGKIDVSDPVATLRHLFSDGAELEAPVYPDCGVWIPRRMGSAAPNARGC